LLQLEEKYLERRRERTKNLENPFRQKTQRRTILGALMKARVLAADKTISKKLKQKTARKELAV